MSAPTLETRPLSPSPNEATITDVELDPIATMGRLRSELQTTGALTAESIRDLANSMQSFTAESLLEAAPSEKKDDLARIIDESVGEREVTAVEFVRGRRSKMRRDGVMEFGRDTFKDAGRASGMKDRFTFHSPEDEPLLEAVFLAAHETGHRFFRGIEQSLVGREAMAQGNDLNNPDAMKDFLIRHPVVGQTGNLTADAAILHERFAETARISAMSKSMRAMGYEDSEINHYFSLVEHYPEEGMTLKSGAHQIDFFDKVTATKSANEFVVAKNTNKRAGIRRYAQPLATKLATRNQKEYGFLGYAQPLSPEEAGELLYDIGTQPLTDNPAGRAEGYFTALKAAHAAHPGAPTPSYNRRLQAARQEGLSEGADERRRTRMARVLGAAVTKLALSRAGEKLLNPVTKALLLAKYPGPNEVQRPDFVPTQETIETEPSDPHHLRLEQTPTPPAPKL